MKRLICLIIISIFSVGVTFAQGSTPGRTRSNSERVVKKKVSKARLINYQKLELIRTLSLPSLNRKNYEPSANVITFSPDSRILASGLNNFGNKTLSDLIFWDTKTGRVKRSIKTSLYLGGLNSVDFLLSGDIIASASDKIKFWNVRTGKYLKSVGESTRSLTISPDGKTIVGGGYECSNCEDPAGVIRIWDMQTGRQKKLLDFGGTEFAPHSVAYSPDGNMLASVSSSIWMWNTRNWSLIRRIKPKYEIIGPVVFSPNGKILVSSGGVYGKRGDITFWNANKGYLLRRLRGHVNHVNSVAFSPDGKTVVSGSHDGTVKLWNVQTGKIIKTLIRLRPFVRPDGVKDQHLFLSVAFSPDGKILATGSTDGKIRIWKIP